MDNNAKKKALKKKSREMRLDLLRMFSHGKAHHFGGSMSCVEMVAALYFYKMNYSKELANDRNRDRFIMSKGHTVPVQYVALAEAGVIPKDELKTIKKLGTRLQGHPDMRKTPGIEAPTGSLGMGLSFGNGIALAGRKANLDFNVFLIVGDGELQEGQVWEAAMTTAHYKLGNVCLLVDRNGYQSQGSIDDLMGVEPLEDKFKSFGWDTARCNGHNTEELCDILDKFTGEGDKPMAIICDTVKGKGISFMENTHVYHNFSLTEEQYQIAENDILGIEQGV
jgi:transketolase